MLCISTGVQFNGRTREGRTEDMARKTGSHADITGPKVRQAALGLFARHGYAAVSMRQIAGEVGVQAGALYTYTPDKQSLLFDLMRGHMEITRLRGVYEGELEAILTNGVEAGLFVLDDVKITVMAIIALLTGLTSWYREGGRVPRTQIEQIYIQLVRGAVCVT